MRPVSGSNPAVGSACWCCTARILARGWTRAGGRPHAEAAAFARCDVCVAGAIRLCSVIEPCAHHGLHPALLADALVVASGVAARVVTAADDLDHVSLDVSCAVARGLASMVGGQA